MEIRKIWIDNGSIYILNAEAKEGKECIKDYAGLRNASLDQLNDYEVSAYGLHWPTLGEDLEFANFSPVPSLPAPLTEHIQKLE